MKYLLIMQICSALTQQCAQPWETYPIYSSHYDCATNGFIKSMSLMKELGTEEVNKAKILINFGCLKQEST